MSEDNGAILARLDVMDTRLAGIEKILEKQNGTVARNTERFTALDGRLVAIETRCSLTSHVNERDHSRMDSEQKANRAGILDLVKSSGNVILLILMVLNMLGMWLGWFK